MARPKFRRAPRLENLESRELLSTVSASQAPSNDEQYMLQVLNLVRTNPQAAVQYLESNVTPQVNSTLKYYGVDLNATLNQIGSMSAQPPLAWSPQLAQSAMAHSQDMSTNGYQDHTGTDGSTPPQRMSAAGYSNATSEGENIYSYADSVDQAMEAFLLDWGVSDNGHRNNILQPNVSPQNAYRDVGIGLVNASGPNQTGPLVVTQDLGAQTGEQSQVVGVAYNDNQGSGLYQPGEGVGGVQITAVNLANGQVSSTQSWGSGGYELGLDPGNYKLIASQNGQVISSQNIAINNVNVEVDFNLLSSSQGGMLSNAISAAQPNNAPAAAPTVAVSPAPQTPAPQTTAAVMMGVVPTPDKPPIQWNWTVSSVGQAAG